MGLGLPIVHHIVTEHRGRCASRPNLPRGAVHHRGPGGPRGPAAVGRVAWPASTSSSSTTSTPSRPRSGASSRTRATGSTAVGTGADALRVARRRDARPRLPGHLDAGADGLDTLGEIKRLRPEPAVIMISGHATIETAVKATRLGAYDFIEKPLSLEKVLLAATQRPRARAAGPRERDLARAPRPAVRDHRRQPGHPRPARTRSPSPPPTMGRVLIHGENGSGKELVARAIHALSAAPSGPFVEVNCAAIPEELIESRAVRPREGRLHRRPRAPARPVRAGRRRHPLPGRGRRHEPEDPGQGPARPGGAVLRARRAARRRVKVDVRVIAATNRDLAALIAEGRFREDLYYRLNVIPIEVPPLRARREDIPLLVDHFLALFCAENGKRPEAGLARGPRLLRRVRLAGQRARAAQHGGAPGDHGARRRHRPRRSPAPLRPRSEAAPRHRGARADAQGGARQFRARLHPGRAAGPRLEHDADRGAAGHRAQPPVSQGQGVPDHPARGDPHPRPPQRLPRLRHPHARVARDGGGARRAPRRRHDGDAAESRPPARGGPADRGRGGRGPDRPGPRGARRRRRGRARRDGRGGGGAGHGPRGPAGGPPRARDRSRPPCACGRTPRSRSSPSPALTPGPKRGRPSARGSTSCSSATTCPSRWRSR